MRKVNHYKKPKFNTAQTSLFQLLNLALNSAWDGFSIWRAIRDRNGKILDFEMIYSNEASVDPERAIAARLVHKPIEKVIKNGDLQRVKRALGNCLDQYSSEYGSNKVTIIDGWEGGVEHTVIALTSDEVLIANLDKRNSHSIVKHHDWLYEHDPLTGLINQVLLDELLSQSFAFNQPVFKAPNWKKVLVADINDPLSISFSGQGVASIIDLANYNSCSFIQTEDLAKVNENGTFEILGRKDHSEWRGCSLLLDQN